MIKMIFDRYGSVILVGAFLVLFLLESRFQLRRRVQSRWKRMIINFVVSIPSFALLRFLFIPGIVWLAERNQAWHFGIIYLVSLPKWAEGLICFFLLDYSNYFWHILLHKLGFLWRFHLVHHTDFDLDLTTAFRFHFGELIASVLFRGAAVVLSGASPVIVLIYEIAFETATQFHHSNSRLAFRLEKLLNKVIVTPRMHGIHHSIIKKEADSNFSTIFSIWDRIHRTIRLNIHQQMIVTGVPSYGNQEELTIGYLLKLPFGKIRPWKILHRSPEEETQKERGSLSD